MNTEKPQIIKWEDTGWTDDEISNFRIDMWLLMNKKPQATTENISAIGGKTITITITIDDHTQQEKDIWDEPMDN